MKPNGPRWAIRERARRSRLAGLLLGAVLIGSLLATNLPGAAATGYRDCSWLTPDLVSGDLLVNVSVSVIPAVLDSATVVEPDVSAGTYTRIRSNQWVRTSDLVKVVKWDTSQAKAIGVCYNAEAAAIVSGGLGSCFYTNGSEVYVVPEVTFGQTAGIGLSLSVSTSFANTDDLSRLGGRSVCQGYDLAVIIGFSSSYCTSEDGFTRTRTWSNSIGPDLSWLAGFHFRTADASAAPVRASARGAVKAVICNSVVDRTDPANSAAERICAIDLA